MRRKFMQRSLSLAVMMGGLMLACQASAQTNVTFVPAPPTPGDWNVDANWNPAFIPRAEFNEIAVIDGNRIAFVDEESQFPVGGINVGPGALEIRNGGKLVVEPGTIVPGNLVVGTTGQLSVGETGGAGAAVLQVAGATLDGITRIVGPSASFTSSGNLSFGRDSTLIPVITGNTHSTINVVGTAAVGGTLRPEFSGYTPALDSSWNLLSAANVSGTFSLDLSEVPDTPRGTGFHLLQTPTATTLQFTNKLLLTVDRATGETSITNVVGNPISIDGYTLTSTGGHLDGTWNSLASQNLSDWDEADNADAFRRTEFNPTGSSTLNVGSSLQLGNLFAPPAPSSFGEPVGEDLAFEYAVAAQGATPGRTVNGIVEFSGGRNNLVLTIDPSTGAAAIQNESPYFDVAIDGYSIRSASGRLQTANGEWNSLQDQSLSDWDEADNSDKFRLTEFNPGGATALNGGGTILNLGTPVDLSGGALSIADFSFEFALSGSGSDGDYNDDGIVDAADYTVWRDNLGSGISLPNDNTPGVGQDDYIRWKENFGNQASQGTMQGVVVFGSIPGSAAGAPLTSQAVPEPSTIVGLVLLSSMLVLMPTPFSCRRLHGEE